MPDPRKKPEIAFCAACEREDDKPNPEGGIPVLCLRHADYCPVCGRLDTEEEPCPCTMEEQRIEANMTDAGEPPDWTGADDA